MTKRALKLIKEQVHDVQYLKEENETGKKSFYVSGIYMQAETANHNGRVYPLEILQKEVARYVKEKVIPKRSIGELGHPDTPTINLERVSHYITELRMEGNDVYGKAKIFDNPYGNIVKNFIEEGIQVGMSSRGLGSVVERSNGLNEVQDDFYLMAVDIVSDPSAPDAFVEGILENRSWIYESGVWKESDVAKAKKKLHTLTKSRNEKEIIQIFEGFLKQLK